MSKGIVMEKHRKYTIVMTQDGSFHKVRPVKNAGIGTEVSYEFSASKKRGLFLFQSNSRIPVRYIAVACLVLLFVMPFYFLGEQNKTYAYVNLDINPSLEIEVDKDLNVVSISPLNDDAKKLIKQLSNYKDKEIALVIEDIMNKSDALGITRNGKNAIVGVSYVNDQEIAILDTVDNYFLTHNTSWDIATFKVPKEIHELSLKENISMNKIMAEKMVVDGTPEIKIKQTRINDDERELIHSFYTNSKAKHQNSKENEPVSDKQNSKDSTVVPQPKKETKVRHASEQKKKNDMIRSREKDKYNNSDKPKEKGEKHKEKQVKHEKKQQQKPKKYYEGKQKKHIKQNQGNHRSDQGKKGDHRNHGKGNQGKKGNHGNHGNNGNHNKHK